MSVGLLSGRLRARSAFTLVELLVVVLIGAVLIAVAAPSFLGQTTKAQDSAAKQYLTVAYKAAKASTVTETGQGAYAAPAAVALSIAGSEPQLVLGVGGFGVESNPLKVFVDDIESSSSRLVLHNQSASGRQCTLDAPNAGVLDVSCVGEAEAPTAPPAAVAPTVNGEGPALTGTAQEGQTLTADAGDWSGSPTQYSYQWLLCADAVSESSCSIWGSAVLSSQTTNMKTLTAAEVGGYVRVQVSAFNAGGQSPAQISQATAQVVPLAPVLSGSGPSIDDTTPQEGQTLTASPGSWTGSPSFSYQWQRESSYQMTLLEDQPLGYWRLGESSGTTAADSSGNGRNGSYQVGVGYGQQGALANDPNTAVAFDGSADYVNVPHSSAFNGIAPLSAEIWVKPNGVQAPYARVFGKGGNLGNSATSWMMSYDDVGAKLRFSVQNTAASVFTATSTTAATNPSTWYHVVGVFTGSTVSIYVNGTLEHSVAFSGTLNTSSADIRLGYDVAANNFFAGVLDEAALYQSALSTTRVQAHYDARSLPAGYSDIPGATAQGYTAAAADVGRRLRIQVTASNAGGSLTETSAPTEPVLPPYSTAVISDAPRLYWRFNESSGNVAQDASGNSNSGTYESGVTLQAPGATSDGNKAANFNGTTLANVYSPDSGGRYQFGSGSFTLEAWAKTSTATGYKTLINKGANNFGAAARYYLRIEQSGALHGSLGDGTYEANAYTTRADLVDGQWHHYTMVVDRSAGLLRLYIDGVQETTAPLGSLGSTNNTASFQVGQHGTLGHGFNGTIDEVAVYPTALSASRIAAHHAAR